MRTLKYTPSLKIKFLIKLYNFFLIKILKKNFILNRKLNDNKIILISEIFKKFEKKFFLCFGTGESVNEIKKFKNIKNTVVVSVTYANYYLKKNFNITSDIWIVNLPEVLDYVMDIEKKEGKIDYSKTYIFIPSFESSAKISLFHPIVHKFIIKHPEAKFIIYHKNEIYNQPDQLNDNHLESKFEPIYCYGNNTLHNTFIPILSYFNFEKIFFLGIDLKNDKGHFFDNKLFYQSLSGKRIYFDSSKAKEELSVFKKFDSQIENKVLRLSKNGTELIFYKLYEKNSF